MGDSGKYDDIRSYRINLSSAELVRENPGVEQNSVHKVFSASESADVIGAVSSK